MNREQVYEWIEEADKRETMEILDATVNRFRELYQDTELILLTVPKGENRQRELERMLRMLK